MLCSKPVMAKRFKILHDLCTAYGTYSNTSTGIRTSRFFCYVISKNVIDHGKFFRINRTAFGAGISHQAGACTSRLRSDRRDIVMFTISFFRDHINIRICSNQRPIGIIRDRQSIVTISKVNMVDIRRTDQECTGFQR